MSFLASLQNGTQVLLALTLVAFVLLLINRRSFLRIVGHTTTLLTITALSEMTPPGVIWGTFCAALFVAFGVFLKPMNKKEAKQTLQHEGKEYSQIPSIFENDSTKMYMRMVSESGKEVLQMIYGDFHRRVTIIYDYSTEKMAILMTWEDKTDSRRKEIYVGSFGELFDIVNNKKSTNGNDVMLYTMLRKASELLQARLAL